MTSIDRPRWTRQPPDVRRRQLLDAASEVILEKGFDAMTVSEVAARAGVGKGTVYLYFDSKTALLLGVRDRYWDRMIEVVEEALGDGDARPWVERLDRLVEDVVAFMVDEMDLYHRLLQSGATLSGRPLDEFTALINAFLSGAAQAGEFDVADPALSANFLVGAFNSTGPKITHLQEDHRRAVITVLKTLFRRTVGVA
jgi:AcrR family transcriptional regulator